MADAPFRTARPALTLLLLVAGLAAPAGAVYTCDLEGWSVIVLDDGRCNGGACKNVVAVLASNSCTGQGSDPGPGAPQEAGA